MIKTVLMIEDDILTLYLNRKVLEIASFCENIKEAYDGNDALSYFENIEKGENAIDNVPEVILFDLNMPVIDGWEFFETFVKKFPEFVKKTNIFILSSSINPEDIRRSNNERNIAAFLEKPLDNKKLDIIRFILDKK